MRAFVFVFQARAARGQSLEALRDLTKAAELGIMFKKDHEVFHERGLIFFQMV